MSETIEDEIQKKNFFVKLSSYPYMDKIQKLINICIRPVNFELRQFMQTVFCKDSALFLFAAEGQLRMSDFKGYRNVDWLT